MVNYHRIEKKSFKKKAEQQERIFFFTQYVIIVPKSYIVFKFFSQE